MDMLSAGESVPKFFEYRAAQANETAHDFNEISLICLQMYLINWHLFFFAFLVASSSSLWCSLFAFPNFAQTEQLNHFQFGVLFASMCFSFEKLRYFFGRYSQAVDEAFRRYYTVVMIILQYLTKIVDVNDDDEEDVVETKIFAYWNVNEIKYWKCDRLKHTHTHTQLRPQLQK